MLLCSKSIRVVYVVLSCLWCLLWLAINPANAQNTSGIVFSDAVPQPSKPPAEIRLDDATTASQMTVTATTTTALGDKATSVPTEPDVMQTISVERRNRLNASAVTDDFRENLNSPLKRFTDISSAKTSPSPTTPSIDAYASIPGSQPQGSLSGKILYLSGGHGWTNDNTSTTMWYTQRPETHGLVEDFGNLDQYNLFAEMCFRAGGTIIPMRPLGHQTIERVVDNDLPQAMFQGEWHDSQSTISFGLESPQVPYRFAIVTTTETAVARFRPRIPKSDYYPVYCWSRDGADRINQAYRVIHSGGTTIVHVDHRKVGKGWVYLGEYYFNRGDDGYVEIGNIATNAAEADGKHVVVADAIRFGNGMGDVNRGGGISGYPREEEASRYWVQRALAAGVEPFYNAFDGTDQRTNVGSPPRMAAHMNRETEGNYFDRIFLSFHSNAAGGRGTVGLFGQTPSLRPDHQMEWAEILARMVNEEMSSRGLKLPVTWNVRNKLTDSHIDFGEIRRDYINNEMTATIMEVAFHDNAEDAKLLREPFVREAMARACLRGALAYFGHYTSGTAQILPPETPVISRVEQDTASQSAEVSWLAPRAAYEGAFQPDHYRIYHSADGLGFDGGRESTGGLAMRFDKLSSGTHYFRVTATNAGGESRPSACLGVCLADVPPLALLVAGNGTSDYDAALSQTATACLGSAAGRGGEFARIIPSLLDRRSQIPSVGRQLAQQKVSFDSATAEAVAAAPPADGKYQLITMLLGRVKSDDLAPYTTKLLAWSYLQSLRGAAVILSGADALLGPKSLRNPGAVSPPGVVEYLDKLLGIQVTGATVDTAFLRGASETKLSSLTLELIDEKLSRFMPREAAVFGATRTAASILRYGSEYTQLAAMLLPRGPDRGPIALYGFPLEELQSTGDREEFWGRTLSDLGVVVSPAAETKAAVEPVRAAVRKPAARKPVAKPRATPKTSRRR